jgi:sugar phosphate permease
LIVERPEDLGLLPDAGQDDGPVPKENLNVNDDSWIVSETLRTKSFWILFFMGMAVLGVSTGINVHLGAYYQDQGLTLTLAAVAIGFSWVVAGFSSLTWGWILEKIESRYAYSMVFLIMGTSTLFLLTVNTTTEAFIVAAMVGSISAGSNVITTIMYANYYGRDSLGRIRGISETGVLLGQSTGPLVAGMIFDSRESYSLVFLIFGGIALACSLIVLTAKPPVRPVGHSPIKPILQR